MSWIDKILPSGISRTEGTKRASVPEGVWTKCVKCDAVLYKPDLERNANVCPKCDHHMRIGARARLDLFLDKDGRDEIFSDIEPIDRLRFRDKKKYTARLATAQKATGERDALVAMRGTLHSMPVVAVAFEFGFHGGSMGQAVGEKFSRAAQLALAERMPLVCFAASGGARMQEALISLMQMAKTSAVIERMHSESVPYVSVMTDPIYGGVSASLALLGDLNIAEPEARAGFAGPNIIEQTIRQKLPKGFQRSEFLLEHGAIDMIVPRLELRDTIARVLAKLTGQAAPLGSDTESVPDLNDGEIEPESNEAESTDGVVSAEASDADADESRVDAEAPEDVSASDEAEVSADLEESDAPDKEAVSADDGGDEPMAASDTPSEATEEESEPEAAAGADESASDDSDESEESAESDSEEEAPGKKPDA